MTVIRNVTGTAFVAAQFRAEENKELHPLYRDPIVPLFLDDETRKAAERIFASFPPIKKMVRIRIRYLDDRLHHQLQLGYQQVVILGAGLDTRVEIDDENILAFKKARFDFERSGHFIWEGNKMYLTATAVNQVLGGITRHVKQFTESFDYVTNEVIAKTTGDPEITRVVERSAAMGAPRHFGISDVQSLAEKATATILETSRWRTFIEPIGPLNRSKNSPIYDY